MQAKLKMVLQNILVPQHPDNAAICGELLAITHDLRTLNTLHTEKFLQQARVTGEQVSQQAACHVSPPREREHVTSLQQHLLYGVQEGWDRSGDNQDRDSTGSRSPQSSDSQVTNHSYSFEDMRRSPIGSVSSTESLGSSETFSKLSVNDLKIHGVGSVLLSALTSPAMAVAGCPVSGHAAARKRSSEGERGAAAPGPAPAAESAPSAAAAEAKCPFKARKLDSPSDSGIDSPKAQGSQSTNTSVCSSPRSSMEDKVKEVEEDTQPAAQPPPAPAPAAKPEKSETLEEQHPLLKRALQQPPQPFNLGGVTGFQDEVYHKKFRHSGRKDSNEPTSTQEVARSPSPGPAPSLGQHSILASQLAAPPTYSQPAPAPAPAPGSVLASTLSRPVAIPGARESEQRNEWLANLILERRAPSQGGPLLMCAPAPAHSNNIPARHLPVPVAPSQPTSAGPGAAPSPRPPQCQTPATKNPHLKMALAGAKPQPPASSVSVSSDSQPLNLSTRTPPPGPAPAPASADIPTEA